MAKAPESGGPSTYDYVKQQEFYANKVKPLLGDSTVKQELVVLRGSGIVAQLNAHLRAVDHERRAKSQGSYIAETDVGLLVEDMRPQSKRPDSFKSYPANIGQRPR